MTPQSLFHSPLGLLDFQADSIARAYLETERGGGKMICWDTGAGKTIFGLRMATLFAEDARDGNGPHDLTIVLAEKGKVGEWVDDVHQFTDLTARKHLGPNRWKQIDKQGLPDVLVTTYETAKLDLVRFVKTPGKRGKRIEPYRLMDLIDGKDVVWVADEIAAKLANRTSAAYKAFDWVFRQRRKTHPATHRVYGLTATPIESGYENAFNQGRLMFPERMPTVAEFEDRYVTSRHPVYRTPRYDKAAIREFVDLFAPVLDRVRKTDPAIQAQFPTMVERSTMVEMGKQQSKIYHQVASLAYDGDDDDEPIPGLWTALRLIADHPASVVEAYRSGQSQLVKMLVESWGESVFLDAGSAKTDELLNRLRGLVGEEHQKVVVFTFFGQTVLPVLQREMQHAGIRVWTNHGAMSESESSQIRQDFRTSDTPGVYLTSDAGCRGINLPEATHLFEFEGSLTYANHIQRINRIHRLTSASPSVTCTTMVTPGTVEIPIMRKMLARNQQTDLLLGDEDAGEEFFSAADRKQAFLHPDALPRL